MLDHAHHHGLLNAVGLYRRLLAGESLPLPSSNLVLDPDETVHMDSALEYARFYGTDVTYQRQSVVAYGSPLFVLGALAVNGIGNASARSQAMAMAAPQWREMHFTRVALTDQRFIVQVGMEWLSFWHSGMAHFAPEPRDFTLVTTYSDCEPMRLRGPAAPWVCVALAWLLYGPETLPGLPAFHGFTAPPPGSQTGL